MLVNLSVKDLALIKEADIDFEKGLNIITGETGAGKSIVIGSINIALGEKVNTEIIRKNADYGYIELVFRVDNNKKIEEKLEALDIPFEDNIVVISRKIMRGQSISKINGVTVTLSNLRQITSDLVDVHGQHDHQSLLHKSKHLEILDEFLGSRISKIKSKFSIQYKKVKQLSEELLKYNIDEEKRLREISFYEYELEEIDNAGLKENEDTELEEKYKKAANSRKIITVLMELSNLEVENGLETSLKELSAITEYDKALKDFYDRLMDLEYVYKDFLRDVGSYSDGLSYDEQEIHELENRIDQINKLKTKYGKNLENILLHREESYEKLEFLKDIDIKKASAENQLKQSKIQLKNLAGELSDARKCAALELEKTIKAALADLNFNDVQFKIDIKKLEEISEKGIDSVEFLISTNPGEPVKPLQKIASGGELSRIMLAIKTILAEKDNIDTLIFDEIDTGISGRTAGQVAKRLSYLGENHQVICITHLAQIASMADTHFLIEKKVENNQTITEINKLKFDERIDELSRILGGIEITEEVKASARQMLEQSKK